LPNARILPTAVNLEWFTAMIGWPDWPALESCVESNTLAVQQASFSAGLFEQSSNRWAPRRSSARWALRVARMSIGLQRAMPSW
jgi:hypothetical protein